MVTSGAIMAAGKTRLRIFDYADYRAFLRDFHEAKKRASPQWSYGVWARQLNAQPGARTGVKSPSALIMVLNGKRNLGPNLARSLCAYFAFDEREAEYFRSLIRLQPLAENEDLGRVVKERILRAGAAKPSRMVDEATYLKISSWYSYAIQQMSSLGVLDRPPAELAAGFLFHVAPADIDEARRRLLEVGLLERDSSGAYRSPEVHLTTTQDVSSAGLRQYHAQVLERAREALRALDPERREISGVTFAMRRASLPRAKALIREFEKNLCELMEAEAGTEADSVVHLEVALLPLFEKERSGNDESSE